MALAAVAAVGLACAVIVASLLPASRNFAAGPHVALSRRAFTDPALLSLYGIGAVAMGAFVAVYNAMGFRLTSEPFALGAAAAGAVFLVYLAGTLSSAISGRLADRYGRRAVMPSGCLLTGTGLAVTVPDVGRLAGRGPAGLGLPGGRRSTGDLPAPGPVTAARLGRPFRRGLGGAVPLAGPPFAGAV